MSKQVENTHEVETQTDCEGNQVILDRKTERIVEVIAKSMTCGSREERIATRMVMSGWVGVRGMRGDIEQMAAVVKGWIEQDKEAISSGKAGFSYEQYYGFVLDALDECSDKLRKVERKL